MKTIFSYISKCLLTYVLSFALLQVQVFLPIQNLGYLNGHVFAAGDGVSLDENGVATKSGSFDLETKKPNMLIDHLSMIAFGFFTTKAAMICKPLPMDVMVAAAGGVIYVGGELFSFNAFKELKEKDTVAYSMKENGENDKQIEMLQAQKKSYDDIAKTAKMKAMIQMAAAASYGVAAGYAFYKSTKWGMTTVACGTCPTAMKDSAKVEGEKNKVAPSQPTSLQLRLLCARLTAAAAKGASNAATASVCSSSMPACAEAQATCNIEVSACNPAAISMTDLSHPEDAFQKFAMEGLKLPGIEATFDDKFIADTIKETYLLDYQEKFNISNFIERESPFYELNSKMEFDDTNFDTQINSYARNRDMSRYFQGELSSTPIDSYEEFRSSMFSLEVSSNSSSLGENLALALKQGVDLIMPSVHANGITKMVAGAAAIYLAINKKTSAWADKFMSTPRKRAMIWTAGAGLAVVAASSSKKIQESAEANSKKIQEIIDKLNNQTLNGLDSLAGNNLAIPSQIPFKLKGNSAVSIGKAKAPCADKPGTSNCGSLKSGIEKSTDFSNLGGSFGALAGAAGAAADGITGSDNIPSSAVDGLVSLSKENNAVQKKLKAAQRKFNQSLEARGEAPLNFKKLNDNILAKLRKNTQAVLSGSGMSAADALSALGPVNRDEDSTEKVVDTPKEKTNLKMKAGTGKLSDNGFKLDFKNEGSNDGLNNAEVLANQQAANALNEESTDDIVSNKDVSIFKVISVRYLKSGFNKLLDEEAKK